MQGRRKKKGSAYGKMELIRPVADDFVFSRVVVDLVLIDLVAPGGIPVLVEEHRVAGDA